MHTSETLEASPAMAACKQILLISFACTYPRDRRPCGASNTIDRAALPLCCPAGNAIASLQHLLAVPVLAVIPALSPQSRLTWLPPAQIAVDSETLSSVGIVIENVP